MNRIMFLCLSILPSLTVAASPPIELARGHQPQATVDATGQVLVVYADDQNAIWLATSNDGKSFAAPTQIIQPRQKLSLGLRRGPRVAVSSDAIVVSYIAGEKGGGKDENLFALRSTDAGKTWSQPLKINSSDGSAREGLHAMASESNGKVLCVWLDLRSGAMEVFGSLSSDSGKTWSENVRIYRSPDGSICECCHPSVTADRKGGWIVMFRNQLNGNRDMYVVSSSDGMKWSEARKLGESSWKLPGCPMDGGALAADSLGTLAVYRRQSDLLLARLDQPQVETRTAAGANPAVLVADDGPTIVYLSHPGGGELLVHRGGKAAQLAPQAQDPIIVAGKSHPIVLWESDGRVYFAPLPDSAAKAP